MHFSFRQIVSSEFEANKFRSCCRAYFLPAKSASKFAERINSILAREGGWGGGGCTKCNVGRLHSTAWGHGGIVGTVGTQSQLQPLHIFHAAYLCYFNVFCICIKNLLAPFLVVFAVPPALPPLSSLNALACSMWHVARGPRLCASKLKHTIGI